MSPFNTFPLTEVNCPQFHTAASIMITVYRQELEQNEQWKKLTTDINKSWCSERIKEYILSRLSLKKLEPTKNFSLSHSKDIGAAISSLDPEFNIGIDIEWAHRSISSRVAKKFRTQLDDQSYSLLELWCLKEAAFKAIGNTIGRNELKIMKPIIINKNTFSWSHLQGTCYLIKKNGLLIAYAFLKNSGTTSLAKPNLTSSK